METLNGKYPFMTAYLKGQEARLVTRAHLEKLMRTNAVPEAVEVIRDTDIGKYLDTVLVTNFDEADKALWGYIEHCLKQIARFDQVPKQMQKVIDAYMVKYDVLNVKAAFEAVISGKKPVFIPLGALYTAGELGELARAQDVPGINAVLNRCGLSEYAGIVNRYLTNMNAPERMALETELDRKYYANLLKVVRKVGDGAALVKAIGTIIDIRNLKILLRGTARGAAAEALVNTVGNGYLLSEKDLKALSAARFEDLSARVPYAYQKVVQEVVTGYGKAKRITVIEDILDRYELGAVRGILSARLMSPVMIVWYLILKENEVRNERLILRALFDNVPLEEIKDYLVMKV